MDVKINVEYLEEYIKNVDLKIDNIIFQKMLFI